MRTNQKTARPHVAGPLSLAGCLGLLFWGCAVPKYRIEAQDVPAGTVQLQVATYVQGALATETPKLPVTGPRTSFTFGLTLGEKLQGDAIIAVAARRADGCLLAVGTSAATTPSSVGSDVSIPLLVPDPPVTDAVCTAEPPVILAAIRREEGPLQKIQFAVLVQGWGFQPTATVSIKSSANVVCVDKTCLDACKTAGMCPPTNTGTCRTDCVVTINPADITHSGPSLLQVNLRPELNNLQRPSSGNDGQPVDLLQLLSQPLSISVTNPDKPLTPTVFKEAPLLPPPMSSSGM